jgi:hypothetical protein
MRDDHEKRMADLQRIFDRNSGQLSAEFLATDISSDLSVSMASYAMIDSSDMLTRPMCAVPMHLERINVQ